MGRLAVLTGSSMTEVTMGIEWGAEIPVDDWRPAWLAEDVKIRWYGGSMTDAWWNRQSPEGTSVRGLQWDSEIKAIRLSADHFAYLAITKGYEPWGGGEDAPADWDGKHALRDDGSDIFAPFFSSGWQRGGFANYVIGYRKGEQEVTPPVLARMTDGEARMLWGRCAAGDLLKTEPRGMMAQDAAVRMLNHLGFIHPDRTPLEQFLAEHPEADPGTADLAIKWARSE